MKESLGKPAFPQPPDCKAAQSPIDIVLLMKREEVAFAASAFSRLDRSLKLAYAYSHNMLEHAPPKLSNRARLVAFSTSVIVSAPVLAAFPGGGYNFHPGPPSYPGNRPSAFACYAGEKQFGVTFHRMLPRVDEGEILDCEHFSIAGCDTSSAIAILAYQRLARLFLMNVTALAELDRTLIGNGVRWTGKKTTLAQYNRMRAVPGDIETSELERRIRAFNWVYTPLDSRKSTRLDPATE